MGDRTRFRRDGAAPVGTTCQNAQWVFRERLRSSRAYVPGGLHLVGPFERPASRQLADYEAPGCNYDLQKVWTEMLAELVTWAERLADKDWLREVSYRTMAGTPYVTPLWQIVLHVVNHGSHHRGQITNMLRQLGIKPANLDLIGFYRSMAVLDQKSTFSAN